MMSYTTNVLVHIGLSAGLLKDYYSRSYVDIVTANLRAQVTEEYPAQRVHRVDTLT